MKNLKELSELVDSMTIDGNHVVLPITREALDKLSQEVFPDIKVELNGFTTKAGRTVRFKLA